MPDIPPEPPLDPKRIDHNDPTVKTMGLYLRKEAEFKAKQEMERLLAEAKRQAGDAPENL
jgi:hypothetical protein